MKKLYLKKKLMVKEMIEELKQEESKYRKIYVEKGDILKGVIADVFVLAITKIERDGIEKTYKWFKGKRDGTNADTKLSSNLQNAYNLVVGKLWKQYKSTRNESDG